jgi:hypothetical protein
MQFAQVAKPRFDEDRPFQVTVIDPSLKNDHAVTDRFRRVFRTVKFIPEKHENIDWNSI